MTTLFTTLPVADVDRSRDFYAALGFQLDPAFGGEGAACFRLGEGAALMLAQRDRVAELSPRPIGDPRETALALWSFTVDAREDVSRIAEAALAAGGTEAHGLEDEGAMVSQAFHDPDGHAWQAMWFAPAEG